MVAPDELTDRQRTLVDQVKQGQVQEQLPDTEDQLLALARLGHLEATHDEDGFHYTVPGVEPPEEEPEASIEEG